MSHVVYWIHFPEETDPYTQGYIGVSSNFTTRLKAHIAGHGNSNVYEAFKIDRAIIEIMLESDEESCYNEEASLRPSPFIGWNFAEGGNKPPSPKGNIARALKASASLKGRKITWGDKISKASKGKKISPDSIERAVKTRKKRGYRAWNIGKKTGPQSIETKEKRSKKMKELKPNARKVLTPLGLFDSITEAAVAHNVTTAAIWARINVYKKEGYMYVE